MAKQPKCIFKNEPDVFGNRVTLYSSTWNTHVLHPIMGHPEMTGYESLVLQLLQDPQMVCPSTSDPLSLAYISDVGVGPRPEGVRVLVSYDTAGYLKGDIRGVVQTAYSIDWKQYSRPKIDFTSPVYKRK